mmetsp:Transcript_4375/g.9810  ORF Transcript_4375/g.9810 Transcript_4375/m.9810 type:complete len:112 (-) Transcript_4375:125-460(-)
MDVKSRRDGNNFLWGFGASPSDRDRDPSETTWWRQQRRPCHSCSMNGVPITRTRLHGDGGNDFDAGNDTSKAMGKGDAAAAPIGSERIACFDVTAKRHGVFQLACIHLVSM